MNSILRAIQQQIIVEKTRYNKFGDFHYRSAEDIIRALKPLLDEFECTLTFREGLVEVAGEVYVGCVATLKGKDGQVIDDAESFAREDKQKAKFSGGQLTGAAISYARKSAMGGLFLLDDGVDNDGIKQAKAKKEEADDRTIHAINKAKTEDELKELWASIVDQGQQDKYKSLVNARKKQIQEPFKN